MKAIKIVILFTALWVPSFVEAECLTQEATIFFGNGIDTDEDDALRSKKRLLAELEKDSRFNPECIFSDLSYNRNGPLFMDWFESALQKADEVTNGLAIVWGSLLHQIPLVPVWFADLNDAFTQVVVDGIKAGSYVVDSELEEHLAAYRGEMTAGRRVIIAAHSQGNFYMNEAYDRLLSEGELLDIKLIGVSLPTVEVADGGPFTTVTNDGLAAVVFTPLLGAPLPNVTNTNTPCLDEFALSRLTLIFCHDFRVSYMGGNQARQKIVNDIIAALPQEASGGTVSGVVTVDTGGGATTVGGAFVSICTLQEGQFGKICDTTLASTTSVSGGGYQFTNLPPCDPCRIWAAASVGGSAYFGQADFSLPANGTATVNVLLGPLVVN